MPIYFYVHDPGWFHAEFLPALTSSRRRKSFVPCLPLCRTLLPSVERFSEYYHLGAEVPLLCRLSSDMEFDKDLWRLLVGELLIFGAVAIPEMSQAPQTLCHLASAGAGVLDPLQRADFEPMQQAHLGTRD